MIEDRDRCLVCRTPERGLLARVLRGPRLRVAGTLRDGSIEGAEVCLCADPLCREVAAEFSDIVFEITRERTLA